MCLKFVFAFNLCRKQILITIIIEEVDYKKAISFLFYCKNKYLHIIIDVFITKLIDR